MQKFEIMVQGLGASQILMHNSQLSNPLNEHAKAIKKYSGKKSKTEPDYIEMARLEHRGSMYYSDPAVGPYIPSDNLFRSLIDGGKKTKKGTALKQGLIFDTFDNMLAYTDKSGKPGPRTPDELWANPDFRFEASVKVGMSRVTRTRPIFHNWAFRAEGVLDTSLVDWEDFIAIANTAGLYLGLGDWRPKFGRYTAKLTKIK